MYRFGTNNTTFFPHSSTLRRQMQNPGQPSKQSMQIARAAVAPEPKDQAARLTSRLDEGMRREVARKGKETTVFYQNRLGLLLEEVSVIETTVANQAVILRVIRKPLHHANESETKTTVIERVVRLTKEDLNHRL
jgi:hypothetical protein